ncbi:MAG: polysaccharide deacetylase family protein [Alphaproteobacteria bacterium]|nr:polysaccharide deacetylase family protein [Alphaproteobacteria bacterium]
MRITHSGPDAFPGPADRRPQLLVVVDAEEEFDWTKPFDRKSRNVSSIFANSRVHEIFDRFSVIPTYCVDQCIAEDAGAVDFLSGLLKSGHCSIGAQLHPWVTPPYDEELSDYNSYHGNLPEQLERAKIKTVTDTIENSFGERPHIFKAGRYGVGRNTIRILKEFGYKVDCSFVPYTSFQQDGGPSFIGVKDQPFWLGEANEILEVPLSKGYSGHLAGCWPSVFGGFFDSELARQLKGPGILAKTGLLERAVLSPEGVSAVEQIRLMRSMLKRGKRIFTLTYHSSSLSPRNTPYVRNEVELEEFLQRIEGVLSFFQHEIGGEFTTLDRIRSEAIGFSPS